MLLQNNIIELFYLKPAFKPNIEHVVYVFAINIDVEETVRFLDCFFIHF